MIGAIKRLLRRLGTRKEPRLGRGGGAELSVGVTGIILRTTHREIEGCEHVELVVSYRDIEGNWRKIMTYPTEHQGMINHCTHLLGLARAPMDAELNESIPLRHEMEGGGS